MVKKSIKKIGKKLLCVLLEAQVRRLRRKHDFKVVAVAGSMGKTSTKLAISTVLSADKRVRFQTGNYNDRLTVPLVFFGHAQPGIFNVRAWARLLLNNEQQIRRTYPYDFVVVELGTDGPGQMAEFAYLKPELGVLTAVVPEHMEYFGTLDAVAAEELELEWYARQLLVNHDDIDEKYLKGLKFRTYGLTDGADYALLDIRSHELKDTTASLKLKGQSPVRIKLPILGKQGAKIVLAAAAAADMLGLDQRAIENGMHAVKPASGRMQILHGKEGSTLIDDTYNASPAAVKAALDVLASAKTPQRIAILGSMNELGSYSEEAHKEVGMYCRGKDISLIVTVGDDAERYLAPAAKAAGCEVVSFSSPYKAGEFVAERLKSGAVVLAKGSQNHVFTEEAIKLLLADQTDAAKLVRQNPFWLNRKRQQFPDAKRG